MARDIDSPMLWQDAVREFTNNILPMIPTRPDGTGDPVAASEEWHNWTDSLGKRGMISDWQYENWDHPDCCLTEEEIRERNNQ